MGVFSWAATNWVWASGRATMSGVDLLALSIPRLYDTLMYLWMEWLCRDEDVRKVHARFIDAITEAASPQRDVPEDPYINPFPGVMRTGPAGVIGQH